MSKTNNSTTNYPLDSHKSFCKRCWEHHSGICPRTGTKAIDKRCRL